MITKKLDIGTNREKFWFSRPENYVYKAHKGLSHGVVSEISWIKNEPEWMRKFRLRALDIFL